MKPLTIGVAGGTGSGKTTVTRALMSAVGPGNVAFLPHDAYYREYNHLTVEARARPAAVRAPTPPPRRAE